MNRIIACTMLVLGVACSTPQLVGGWAPVSELVVPPGPSDADAIILLHETKGRISPRYDGRDNLTEWYTHRAIALLTERGVSQANLRIVYPATGSLSHLQARTIGPDGAVTVMNPEEVLQDSGRGSKKKSEYEVRTFAFPKAQVGSILEFRYLTSYPHLSRTHWEYVSSEYPVRRYRVEISGPEDVYYRVEPYNVKGVMPWSADRTGDGGWRLTWSVDDVPARKSERFAGNQRLREPCWFFSVQAFVKSGRVWHVNSTWDKAVEFRGEELYVDIDDHYEGFAPSIDASSCRNQTCRIELAVSWATQNLPWESHGGLPGRKLREVLDAKEASSAEKARAIWMILNGLGVESRFALYHHFLEGRIDPDFPDATSLEDLLLYIPKQPGIEEAFWLDPACEHCRLGELPYWAYGADAVVVDHEKVGLSSKYTFSSRLLKVEGTPVESAKYTIDYTVNVAESGDVEVQARVASGRMDAQRARARLRSTKASDWEKAAEKFATARIDNAVLTGHEPPAVDQEIWRVAENVDFRAPGYAVNDGEALVVPLSFLKTTFDDGNDPKTRGYPVRLSFPYFIEENAIVVAPRGYVIRALVAGGEWKGPIEVQVTADGDGRVARVRRRIFAHLGEYPATRYPEVRESLEAFRALRRGAITFVRTAEPQARAD